MCILNPHILPVTLLNSVYIIIYLWKSGYHGKYLEQSEYIRWDNGGGIFHNSACIDHTALIENGAIVHSDCMIAKDVQIGSGTVVGPSTSIGESTKLGFFFIQKPFKI